MWQVLTEFVNIVVESSVYLLLGFALAGVMHVVLRRTPRFMNLLAQKGSRSVTLAALLGAPLPLCSCGVVPAAMTLRKRGASKGATVSFLISCPETDVVSVLLTYALLGPIMAVFRPLAAIVTAIIAGRVTDLVDRDGKSADCADFADREARDTDQSRDREGADGGPLVQPLPNGRGSDQSEPSVAVPACCGHDKDEEEPAEATEYVAGKGPVWNAFHYGFVSFFDDIIGSLLLGLLMGGLIAALLPRFGLENLAGGSSLIAMLVMLVVGIPMYVCAAASTPIAAGLVVSGLSPGTALVFLLAGPATNLGSLLVLHKQLGRRVLLAYLVSIAVVSVAMGLWLDAAFGRSVAAATVLQAVHHHEGRSLLKIAGAIALLVLALLSFQRRGGVSAIVRRVNQAFGSKLKTAHVKLWGFLILVALYVASGFFSVGPGERAVVTRFGRITASHLLPGLHYHWPYPLGRADVASVSRVQAVELGFRRRPADMTVACSASSGDDRALQAESWVLTGHEDIIDIKWVVFYQVRDTREDLEAYLYGVADSPDLIRSAADSAIRVAVGGRGLDTLLTTDREEVEQAAAASLQAALGACRAGVRVVHVGLVDVHAPPDVHWAFRDVASAAEDRAKLVNQAQEYLARVVPGAEGDREKDRLAAEGRAAELVGQASGRSAAFASRLAAYRQHPAVTRLRLHLEAVDAVLPRLNKYIRLYQASGGDTNLWLVPEAAPGPALPPFWSTTRPAVPER